MLTAGEDQLAKNSWRLRDDLEPGSFSALLAAHWADMTPQRYKESFKERVLDFMTTPRSRSTVPNYSIGTRGLPFINQLPFDGESFRGDPTKY